MRPLYLPKARHTVPPPRILGRRLELLGWSSAENSALDSILKNTFPKVYGTNWLANLAPLKIDQVREIVKAAMYYYGLGYGLNDYATFKNPLQASFPKLDKLAITKVLAFISGIDPAVYPADVDLLKTSKSDQNLKERQNEISSEAAKADLQYEIQDKIDRGVSAIGKSAMKAAQTVNNALPWYFRAQVVLPLAVVAAGAYLWIQTKGVRSLIPGRRRNPISKREAAAQVYKLFHDFPAKKIKKIAEIDTSEIVELGTALDLSYRSNKWTGKNQDYIHEFGKGVKVFCTTDRKTLLIQGGKMEVQDVGIVH